MRSGFGRRGTRHARAMLFATALAAAMALPAGSALAATPILQQNFSPGTNVIVNTQVTDNVLIANGVFPANVSGTIIVFGYSNGTCSAGATQLGATGNGQVQSNGNYPITFTPNNAGFPQSVQAVFVTNNPGVNDNAASPCQPFTVNKATPTVTSNATPNSVIIGGAVSDNAHVGGGFNPTGNVTFNLYNNGTCTGPPTFTSGPHNINGSGDASSNSFNTNTTSLPGDYFWAVTYSGDGNNNAAATGCADASEKLTIQKASPTVSTQASPDVAIGINNSFTGSLSDTATINGGFTPVDGGGANVVFRVYGPNDTTCSGTPTTLAAVPVTGNTATSPPFNPARPPLGGTNSYRWTAQYSGNQFNNGFQTPCNDPNELNRATGPTCDGKAPTIWFISGTRTINGTGGDDVIYAGSGAQTVNGGGGNDTICGGSGEDTLNGDSGNDRIFGDSGADKLNGGTGNSYCEGGSGTDTFVNCTTVVQKARGNISRSGKRVGKKGRESHRKGGGRKEGGRVSHRR